LRLPRPSVGPSADPRVCPRVCPSLVCPSLVGATALALCLAAGLVAGPVAAGNWTLGGSVSQRVEARDTFGGDGGNNDDDEDGITFRSTTRLGLGLGYQTPSTSWLANSSISYRASTDSNSDEGLAEGLDGITNPRVSGSVTHQVNTEHVIGATASYARRSLDIGDSVLFEDEFGGIDVVEVVNGVTETRASFGGNWRWSATPRTSIGLGSGVTIRRYSEDSPDVTPSTSVSVNGSVSRALDTRTSGGFSVSYRNLRSDEEFSDIQTNAVTFLVNASRVLTPRHSLGLSAGAGFTRRSEEAPIGVPVDDGTNVNFQGGVNFAYSAPRDMALGISLQQSLEPRTDGTLANTTSLSVGLSQPLTQRISYRLNGAYARQDSSGDVSGRDTAATQAFRMSTGLTARLAPLWSASTGIDLRQELNQDEENQTSAGVFLQISRALTLNP
jgi:hypothetical protein